MTSKKKKKYAIDYISYFGKKNACLLVYLHCNHSWKSYENKASYNPDNLEHIYMYFAESGPRKMSFVFPINKENITNHTIQYQTPCYSKKTVN